jgi:hypothetical protein
VRVMWCNQSFFSAGTIAALENSDSRNRRRELTAAHSSLRVREGFSANAPAG